jgi:hypothetical protein
MSRHSPTCFVYVVVGHVHAAGVGHVAVDDYNLPVVACEHVVYPREAYRVELVYLYAFLPELFNVLFLKRPVVGVVAETVEQRPHLDPLLGLLPQYGEQFGGYRVVAEVEVLKVDAAFGLPDGFEHVVKLLLPRHQQHHFVVVGERHALLLQHTDNGRVAGGRGFVCRCSGHRQHQCNDKVVKSGHS